MLVSDKATSLLSLSVHLLTVHIRRQPKTTSYSAQRGLHPILKHKRSMRVVQAARILHGKQDWRISECEAGV